MFTLTVVILIAVLVIIAASLAQVFALDRFKHRAANREATRQAELERSMLLRLQFEECRITDRTDGWGFHYGRVVSATGILHEVGMTAQRREPMLQPHHRVCIEANGETIEMYVTGVTVNFGSDVTRWTAQDVESYTRQHTIREEDLA